LCGQRPFYPENDLRVIRFTCDPKRRPLGPRKIRGDVPLALEEICLKCLEKQKDNRFRTMDQLADALDEYARNKTLRKNKTMKWVLGAIVVVLLANLLLIQSSLSDLGRRVDSMRTTHVPPRADAVSIEASDSYNVPQKGWSAIPGADGSFEANADSAVLIHFHAGGVQIANADSKAESSVEFRLLIDGVERARNGLEFMPPKVLRQQTLADEFTLLSTGGTLREASLVVADSDLQPGSHSVVVEWRACSKTPARARLSERGFSRTLVIQTFPRPRG
jgi:hypothetical protein